ncbi:T9SS type A sorting domain-containing protein [Mucilaginibacter pallidiroseus]|nr:T9SS type A sorting domain-containing protein [Mucilaginibacter pallidiroseus]
MKKILTKPGFEVIFSLTLITIMALPPLVLAQTQKSIEIKIVNGDTTINGKNIKKLNAAERKDALAVMSEAPVPPPTPPVPGNNSAYTLNQNKDGNTVIIEKQVTTDNDSRTLAGGAPKRIRLKRITTDSTYSTRLDGEPAPMKFRLSRRVKNGMDSRNSQSASYSNTDSDGITTTFSYTVNDAPADKLKALTGADKATLDISDLYLSYEFSTAKSIISLNVPAGSTELKLTNSNGNTIWAEKTSATSFTKKFVLPVNGVYYLQAKQGSKVALKKIVKE